MSHTSLEAAFISEQGLRAEMEDAHFLDGDFAGRGWVFGGIYDGHGGKLAAQYAARHLHLRFKELVLNGSSPQSAFEQSYRFVSDELSYQDSGTTAVTFLIKEGIVYTANVGDSRAIVVGRSSFQQLTEDHRIENKTERDRVLSMGGVIEPPYVFRNGTGIMPTRTIGDEYFKAVGVIATPSITEYEISQDDLMLVAACDGLFDFMSNDEVAKFTRANLEPKTLLDALRDEVLLKRSGTDNLTIIAISLPNLKRR